RDWVTASVRAAPRTPPESRVSPAPVMTSVPPDQPVEVPLPRNLEGLLLVLRVPTVKVPPERLTAVPAVSKTLKRPPTVMAPFWMLRTPVPREPMLAELVAT